MMRSLSAAAAVTMLSGMALGQVIAFQSFEEADASLIDRSFQQANTDATGGALNLGDRVALVGDAPNDNLFNWSRTGDLDSSELSFNSFYTYVDEDSFVGITGFNPGTFAGYSSFNAANPGDPGDDFFTDGSRGLQFQGFRGGQVSSEFERVNFAGPQWQVSIDIAFQSTNFEFFPTNEDIVNVFAVTDTGEIIDLIFVNGDDINNGLNDLQFRTYTADLSGFQWAELVISTTAFESVWFDNIVFEVPAPGAAGLLAVAGLAAARRRRG